MKHLIEYCSVARAVPAEKKRPQPSGFTPLSADQLIEAPATMKKPGERSIVGLALLVERQRAYKGTYQHREGQYF